MAENVLEKSLAARQKECLVNSESSVVWMKTSTEYRESSLKHSSLPDFYLVLGKDTLAILSTLTINIFQSAYPVKSCPPLIHFFNVI